MNGFTDKEWSNPDKIENIELVLEDMNKISVMCIFKNLKTLTLINLGIASIEGLEDLSKLENLCLNENLLTKLSGLSKCINLKSLHVSHNQIVSTLGLECNTKLEILWICDNKIDVEIYDNNLKRNLNRWTSWPTWNSSGSLATKSNPYESPLINWNLFKTWTYLVIRSARSRRLWIWIGYRDWKCWPFMTHISVRTLSATSATTRLMFYTIYGTSIS